MSGTENSLVSIFTTIFAWYHLFLMVSSIILNPLVAFVCVKSRKLRSTSTFKLLAFNSINDIIVCFEWNLADFANTVTGYNLSRKSLVYCRLATYFLQYSTMNLSSWMYVSISLDRLLSLFLANWTRVHFARFRPYYYSAILAAIMFAVNFNEVFTVGYSFVGNGSQVVVCNMNTNGSFPWNIVMAQISIYFGNLIPFCLLLIFNALIIYKATKFVRKRRSATSITVTKRRAQMTRTILFITFLYIALTLPGVLIGGFFYTDIIALQAGPLIVSAINAVQFTYPALNFFILYFSNKLFAQQAKLLLFKCSSN